MREKIFKFFEIIRNLYNFSKSYIAIKIFFVDGTHLILEHRYIHTIICEYCHTGLKSILSLYNKRTKMLCIQFVIKINPLSRFIRSHTLFNTT